MSAVVSTAISGFALGAGLIIAIGAQNAFVLRQGLRAEHIWAVVAVCVVCDWALIAVGALGFGWLVARLPLATSVAAWGGALYLVAYGAMSLRSAFRSEVLDTSAVARSLPAVRPAVIATLAVSLLNPHVYLDTVVLLGSVAGQYPPTLRAWFAAGAACASLVWFCALGFGAKLLAPLFGRPMAWRVLDAAVAAVMWWIAVTLVVGEWRGP